MNRLHGALKTLEAEFLRSGMHQLTICFTHSEFTQGPPANCVELKVTAIHEAPGGGLKVESKGVANTCKVDAAKARGRKDVTEADLAFEDLAQQISARTEADHKIQSALRG